MPRFAFASPFPSEPVFQSGFPPPCSFTPTGAFAAYSGFDFEDEAAGPYGKAAGPDAKPDNKTVGPDSTTAMPDHAL